MEGLIFGILRYTFVLHSAHSRRYRVNYLVLSQSLEDILGYISGIRHEDRAEMDQVFFDAPSRSEQSTFKKCNKEITSGRINVTKVQKLVRDTLLRGYDIYPNQLLYVQHRICLHFKYGPRNRGSFVRSQPIQKENKRTLKTQIGCDPGRNPVSYRKPRFCKRRV